MMRAGIALILLGFGSAAMGAETNFGIRTVGGQVRNDERMGFGTPVQAEKPAPAAKAAYVPGTASGLAVDVGAAKNLGSDRVGSSVDMGAAKGIGAHWGRVTSTYRSAAHNRRVGGVANSYHLRNRAIDIARRPGVAHWQIAAAFRAAGYNLLESLDEGDHSHFAFGGAGEHKHRGARPQMVVAKVGEKTEWRIVYAPSAGGN